MKLGNSRFTRIIALTIITFSMAAANYFVLRGTITAENTYYGATAQAIEKYLEKNNEKKVFGSIVCEEKHSIKKTFNSSIVKWVYNKNIYETNSVYYISQPNENYTPIEYTVGEFTYTPTVLIMPFFDNTIDIKSYFNLNFLTKISDEFPHKRANTAIIPREIADQIINTYDLKTGDYTSLLLKTMPFIVTKNTTFDYPFVIAGVFDDNDEKGKFYKDAYGVSIITSHTIDEYYVKNVKLNIEFGKNTNINKSILQYIERELEVKGSNFSWSFFQKQDNKYVIDSIEKARIDSKKYFSTLENFDVSVVNFLMAMLLIGVLITFAFFITKITNKRKLYILFAVSSVLGTFLSMIFINSTGDKYLPINEFIRINCRKEAINASIFTFILCAIIFVIIMNITDEVKKYV